MSNIETITLNPIGFVKTKAIERDVKDRAHVSELILQKDLAAALDGIEEFSHLFVLFWMYRISNSEGTTVKVHPRGRRDLPWLGVFATKTPLRPNPIGLTLVELVKIEDHIVTVRGLDAFDGTPILDIKPFDKWDVAEEAKVPTWSSELEKEKLEK